MLPPPFQPDTQLSAFTAQTTEHNPSRVKSSLAGRGEVTSAVHKHARAAYVPLPRMLNPLSEEVN